MDTANTQLIKTRQKPSDRGGIYPNNEHTKKMLDLEKMKEEERLREEREKKKKTEMLSIEEMIKKNKDSEERRRQQELNELEQDISTRFALVSQMEGNLIETIRTLINNTSSYDLNFAGLELDAWNFTNLMLFLPENKSLLNLNISRKGLGDNQASQLGEMLKANKKLRRLELEGNLFGSKSCKPFAEALKYNKTLRYLDLENNRLTDFGKDISGIEELFEALKYNTSLISLNLSGNCITEQCGNSIINCLRHNKTLIHLELMNNSNITEKGKEKSAQESKFNNIGLNINQINQINECLASNREIYENYRKEEWRERKAMRIEDQEVRNFNTHIGQKK